MFAGAFLIMQDMRLDLSDGYPRASVDGETVAVGWPSLRIDDLASRLRDRSDPRPTTGAIVKMLGYMMDGYEFAPSGTEVKMFVLMPEAGHFLHPAHRIPDEMVEVWPKAGRVIFNSREMVWVTGRFERLTSAREEQALYALRGALVTPASKPDITAWFKQ